jgi:hypothetical protein
VPPRPAVSARPVPGPLRRRYSLSTARLHPSCTLRATANGHQRSWSEMSGRTRTAQELALATKRSGAGRADHHRQTGGCGRDDHDGLERVDSDTQEAADGAGDR